jgi:lupus La protein
LIIGFTLKSMSDGGSTEKNGTNDTANDDKIVCKTDGGLVSSENETRETEKTVVKNVSEDEETPGENIEKDNKEKVDRNNGLESEEKETEDIEKSPEGPTEMSDEKEEKRTAASYIDDMNVVLREDLKGVFQKYGTVKVLLTSYFL